MVKMPAFGDISLGTPTHAGPAVHEEHYKPAAGADALVTNVVVDAHTAAAHSAYALSDLVFVLPGHGTAAGNALGEVALHWAANGGANAHGRRVTAKSLISRPGVGGAIVGAAQAGQAVSAFLPSTSLHYVADAVKQLSKARVPATLHVLPEAPVDVQHHAGHGQKSSAAPLRVDADVDGVIAAAHAADVPLVVSSTVQEAADVALLAHVLSARGKVPVIHAVGAAALGGSAARARLLRYSDLATAAAEASGHHFDDAASSLYASGALATRYGAVSYDGHAHPEVVLVVAGPGAAVAAAVAARLAVNPGLPVGVVTVTLLNPWPAGAVRAAVPRSARRVIAVSFGQGPASSSAFNHLVAKAIPAAVPVRIPGSFTATHAERLLHAAVHHGLPVTELVESVSLPLPSHNKPARHVAGPGVSYGILGLSHDGSATLGKSTLHVLERAGAKSLTAHFTDGVFERGAVSLARVTADAPATSSGGRDSDAVDVLVVSHHALLRSFDIPALVKPGGVVVVNAVPAAAKAASGDKKETGQDGKEIVVDPADVVSGELSGADEEALAARGARLLAIDGGALCTAAGLGADALPLALQAALFAARGGQALAQISAVLEAEQRHAVPANKASNLVRLHRAVRAGMQAVRLSAKAVKHGANAEEGHHNSLLAPLPAVLPAVSAPAKHTDRPGVGPDEYKPVHNTHSAHAGKTDLQGSVLTQAESVQRASIALTFPSAYGAQSVPILENAEAEAAKAATAGHEASEAAHAAPASHGHGGAIHTVRVTKNARMTPLEYDRNIFHIEMDISGTGLTYEIGSALGVYAVNDGAEVEAFLKMYGIAPETPVGLPVTGGDDAPAGAKPLVLVQTAKRLFTHELDLLGKPGKDFYEKLAAYATDKEQALHLRFLGSEAKAGAEGYKAREDEGYSHADVLAEFTSARPSLAELIALLPRIKARHYSIASSARMHPTSVHLCVVEVSWTTPKGKTRYGQCSHFLANAKVGSTMRVSVLPSEMLMPADHMKPIAMAGLGTGMAPFRAFIQERAALVNQGHRVGPVVLYMGSRHRAMEYLYGDELEEYARRGIVTGLRLAFSRDGPKKVYIQHLMAEDGALLYEYLHASKQAGSFYLCGPTWPEPDVEAAITNAFATPLTTMPAPPHPALSSAPGFFLPNTPTRPYTHEEAVAAAKAEIKAMKEAKRYVLEVY